MPREVTEDWAVEIAPTRKYFLWAGRAGFGFRINWIEVQVYWTGPGNRDAA